VGVQEPASRARATILPLGTPLEPVGARGRIGLLALATDVNSESDLRRMTPPGVEVFTNRIANANPVTMDNHRAMAGDITRAARGILPGNRLDIMVYGCTTGTVAIGERRLAELIREARPGIPCTNPIAAIRAAFGVFGARRISLLTPYTRPVNADLVDYIEAQGVEVLNVAGFDLDSDDDMTALPPPTILEAGLEVCDPRADLLFVSCTAMRTTLVLGELEGRLGRPVVASNQALLWHALRLIDNRDPVSGFGRLFDHPLPSWP
jgi:maleate isomerase